MIDWGAIGKDSKVSRNLRKKARLELISQLTEHGVCPECGNTHLDVATMNRWLAEPGKVRCASCGWHGVYQKALNAERHPRIAKVADTKGQPLMAGRTYIMRSTQYKVPDVISGAASGTTYAVNATAKSGLSNRTSVWLTRVDRPLSPVISKTHPIPN